ncbi:hypothetical protein N7490_007380 [Penicillium lividum]|nr:hypothetical protein N7490_007380 [Penicillium lividum]
MPGGPHESHDIDSVTISSSIYEGVMENGRRHLLVLVLDSETPNPLYSAPINSPRVPMTFSSTTKHLLFILTIVLPSTFSTLTQNKGIGPCKMHLLSQIQMFFYINDAI